MKPEFFNVKYFDTFYQLVDEFKDHGDKIALSWFDADKNKITKTYQEFLRDIIGLRNKMVASGISRSI